jgi:hypothetical protein
MAYGLNVYNDSLGLQIDSTYCNYCLYEHGESVSTALKPATVNYYIATVTFSTATSIFPLIAIKPSSANYCGLSYVTKSGSNYTGFVVHSYVGTSVTFDWQAFVPRIDKSSETYGIRVYDSTPQLVFDGGHRQMIILDVDTASPAYNATGNITHPSDANAYFIMAPWGWWQVITDTYPPVSSGANYWGMMKYVSATTIDFGGLLGATFSIPASISFSDGYWPSVWTILTVEKAF